MDTDNQPKFTLKKLNLVTCWDYDEKYRECMLCKRVLQAPCPQELETTNKLITIDAEISVGECKHMFHKKCIDAFVSTTGEICPIDKTIWKEIKKIRSNAIHKNTCDVFMKPKT